MKQKMSVNQVVVNGILGGIVGGIVFGIMMQMMGKMPMIASLVGGEGLFVGWIVHMIISIIFGVGFGGFVLSNMNLLGLSFIYGVVIWILGPLLIMPLMMGMGTNFSNAFAPQQLMNLGTHIFFTLLVAIVFKMNEKRLSSQAEINA
ncbi:hypothetical protein [Pontibacillus sp. HMF3514]|uniref:hypothetical protein n=1 Tax=Pontibacillus sp. HMF3514 TaxID=2692425 RepID=UPI00131F8E8E|nr:hypothetical protein [Pontibacillus sp. HMF3514]QHE53577.1 hypothetical protein GS400_16830 [Pontibacillus sp. HMF3514]